MHPTNLDLTYKRLRKEGGTMTRYQLAKLVAWADILDSRKRLQKVAFLLQAAGCPLEADFILHRPGPYSEYLSRLTDEMVRLGMLEENATESPVGSQYSYRLSPQTSEEMRHLEQAERGRRMAEQMAPFEKLAMYLLFVDVKELEVAATVMYFRRQGLDWPAAKEKASVFKSIPTESSQCIRAVALARSVVEPGHHCVRKTFPADPSMP
jgi:uncharacterized protein YwgA